MNPESHGATRTAPPDELSSQHLLRWVALLALIYGFLVIYGSLLPFDVKPVPLTDAWERFSNIPYLSIGAGKRADWVANILLFIPLAFLWCARAALRRSSRWGAPLRVLVACCAFAVVIEFCQLWFAPRTVSQNDIIAEGIGSAIGVLIWVTIGQRLLRMCTVIAAGGAAGLIAALTAYTGAYVIYALLPFDFAISVMELETLVRKDGIMPFVSPKCGGVFRCGVKSIMETASFIPLGFLLVIIAKNRRRPLPNLLTGAAIGALASFIIEGSQIFIVSAASQWVSVVTRAIGMAVGVFLGGHWNTATLARCMRIGPALFFVGGLGYVLFIGVVILRGAWRLDGAVDRFYAINWLPFFYHYWTTEQAAVVSLVFNAVLYAPIGVGFWLWRFRERGGYHTDFPGAGGAAATAVLIAFIVESSRLLHISTHPDPTNIIIGGIAALLAFKGLGWFVSCLMHDPSFDRT